MCITLFFKKTLYLFVYIMFTCAFLSELIYTMTHYSRWCICVCGCWMTVCQGSTHTHMAGGQDIPARAPQDLIPLVSLGAVASGHVAQALKHRLNLKSPASHCPLPSAKRYIFTIMFLISLFSCLVLWTDQQMFFFIWGIDGKNWRRKHSEEWVGYEECE